MRRDNGTGLAFGAAAALALLGAWGASRGSLAKGRPSEEEIQRGRLIRDIKRIVERGPTNERDEDGRPQLEGHPVTIRQISTEIGADLSAVEREAMRLASPSGGGGYYLEGQDGQPAIGQISPTMRWLTERVGKLKNKNPELAIRLVDVVISHLGEQIPLTAKPSGIDASAESLESDIREAVEEDLLYKEIELTPGEELKGYANLYHEALKDRRILRTPKNEEDWREDSFTNFDMVSTDWRGYKLLPWIESVIEDAIERDYIEQVQRLLDNLTFVLDWVDAPGRGDAIRAARRAARRRAEREAQLDRGQLLPAQPQAQEEEDEQPGEEVFGPEELTPGIGLDQAMEYATAWDRRQVTRTSKELQKALRRAGMWFACPDGIHPIQSPVVHRHANGWTWRKISTFEEKAYEGNMGDAGNLRSVPRDRIAYGYGCLRHCIGTHHISDYTERNGYLNYSLRTPDNRPLLTITVRNGMVIDFAGFANRKPGTLGTHGGGTETNILNMLQKEGLEFKNGNEYLDAEVQMVKEFFDAMGLNMGSSHVSAVASRLKDIEERKRAAKADGSPNRWRSYSRASISGKMRDAGGRRSRRKR